MFNPLHERISIKELIAAQIEEAILNKKYLPGGKLPSENELCKMFGVSPCHGSKPHPSWISRLNFKTFATYGQKISWELEVILDDLLRK